MDQQGDSAFRPLLVNGEALRFDAKASRSGGGGKFHPRTVEEAQAMLARQVVEADEFVARLPQSLRAKDRVYIELKLLPNYIAPSYFPTELVEWIRATHVGSRTDVGTYIRRSKPAENRLTRRLILAVPDEGVSQLRQIVAEGVPAGSKGGKKAFEQIREIDEIAPPRQSDILCVRQVEDGARPSAPRTWEAVLHPCASRHGEPVAVDDETLEKWFALVADEGGRVYRDYIRRVGGLTFMPVRLDGKKLAALARFNPLRVLRPMPSIRPRPRFGARSLLSLRGPATGRPILSDVSVAVFDGGVDAAKTADGSLFDISDYDLTPEPPQQECLDHGTGVTGAVLYGLVGPGQRAPTPPLPVESYRVLPAPHAEGDLEGYWVLDRIKETVASGNCRIVNLSVGPSIAVEDDMEPNRWTSELDRLAWEKDVLFVVAAGNDGERDRAAGLHRVQAPADMVNGIAVGACDEPFPKRPWGRAPYSSMGPGRHGSRVQPLGVQFGGTERKAFNVLRADGSFLEAMGTSFSAPVTTHALAELVTRLPRATASVLRAFAVHFAERPNRHHKLRDEVGYGRHPLSFADCLVCGPHEVHVLYADEIRRDEFLGYEIPVPDQVTSDIELRITLAYASPVDPAQPTEYTNASLTLNLHPHRQTYSFKPPDKDSEEKSKKCILGSDEALDLLARGWGMSDESATKPLSNSKKTDPEVDRREAGKWETIRHYRQPLRAEEVANPWLKVSCLARRGGSLDDSSAAIPFALLISVISKSKESNLYDEVRSRFKLLRPVQRVQPRLRT